MKNSLIIICFVFFLAGCAEVNDFVFDGPQKKALREQHQRLMELYDLQVELIKAKLDGNTNITDSDIQAVSASISEIEAQQRHEQQINARNELLRTQQQQHQQQMDQLQQIQQQQDWMEMQQFQQNSLNEFNRLNSIPDDGPF